MPKDPNPADFDDPTRLRAIAVNAGNKGRADLVSACNARIAELAGLPFDDAVEREFWVSVTLTEEIMLRERGKTVRLSRTRLKEKRDGAFKCVEDFAAKSTTTDGFALLVDAGRPDLLFEAIALRNADRFSEATLAAAQTKLDAAGVDLSAPPDPAAAP